MNSFELKRRIEADPDNIESAIQYFSLIQRESEYPRDAFLEEMRWYLQFFLHPSVVEAFGGIDGATRWAVSRIDDAIRSVEWGETIDEIVYADQSEVVSKRDVLSGIPTPVAKVLLYSREDFQKKVPKYFLVWHTPETLPSRTLWSYIDNFEDEMESSRKELANRGYEKLIKEGFSEVELLEELTEAIPTDQLLDWAKYEDEIDRYHFILISRELKRRSKNA